MGKATAQTATGERFLEHAFGWPYLACDDADPVHAQVDGLTGARTLAVHNGDAKNPSHPSLSGSVDTWGIVVFRGLHRETALDEIVR